MQRSKRVTQKKAKHTSRALRIKNFGLFKKLTLNTPSPAEIHLLATSLGWVRLLLQFASLTRSEQDVFLFYARRVLDSNG